MSKATDCVHAGAYYDKNTKGLVTPVFPSTAYDYVDSATVYPRYFNTPNQLVVVKKLAKLERAETGLVMSSGMAAITKALFSFLKTGDHAIFQKELYGGTINAIGTELRKFGVDYTFVEVNNVSEMEAAIRPNTRLIYVETPSNPLLKIVDIKQVAQVAKAHNLKTIIDNTFASPINLNPIAFGIDIVTHSGTKYLGGHSDICCGVIVASKELTQQMWNTAINYGGSLNAETCALLERSLKTLDLRVKKQNDNAGQVAEFLAGHRGIDKVYYPGLTDHEGHDIAKAQMHGFGGMVSFDVGGSASKVNEFLGKLNYIKSALSLGGVESTICSPTLTSHAKITAEERAALGISDSTLRMSVGIEDAKDLIAELDGALS